MKKSMRSTIGRSGTAMLLLLLACSGPAWSQSATRAHELEGLASWYAGKFQGRLTASGEIFDTNLLTAAHKTLPFGTIVEVAHVASGLTVQVRINDRGPFVDGRVIDLSRAAAEALDMTGEGVAAVSLSIVAEPEPVARSIQVGAFGDRTNAEQVRMRVTGAGLPAEIETVSRDGGNTVYRVIVPGIPEAEVAGATEKLASAGFESVLVRSR